MTEQFVPPGYIGIRDYNVTDDKSLRHRFASGELVAAVWNPRTGELVEIARHHWLSDWSQVMIDKGTFRNISGYAQSESLPVLVKIDEGHNRRVSNPAYELGSPLLLNATRSSSCAGFRWLVLPCLSSLLQVVSKSNSVFALP